MKVIKRDGRAVEYNFDKICIAIEKANKEVKLEKRATPEEIQKIVNYIENLDKKRILVEDIQDIIEQKLMEFKKFELAKKYIVYRYTRALVRKQNTTDESILGLIKNTLQLDLKNDLNKTTLIASMQRNLIASEVSKDLTKRMLLPEKISRAHENGILYFHNSDYYLQPVFNCSLINLKDILDNGTTINGKKILSPKSFYVSCIVMTQIISVISTNQYGGQTIDISCLGKYLRKSYNKIIEELKNYGNEMSLETIEKIAQERLKMELKNGIQMIDYQLNALYLTTGKKPSVTLFLNINGNNEFQKELELIIEEILKQRYNELKNIERNKINSTKANLIYVLNEDNSLTGGKYDYLTQLTIECSKQNDSISYISEKKMKENYDDNIFPPIGENHMLNIFKNKENIYQFEGRFNQGLVTINLVQIGINSKNDESEFWKLLDERLELCYEALMCRHYSLLGTLSDVSPIHWQSGAIARLKINETIDKFLKSRYSTLSLGYMGIEETILLVKGKNLLEKEGFDFAIKILKYLKKVVTNWSEKTDISFVTYALTNKKVTENFLKIDKELFGDIENITDKENYSLGFYINNEEMDVFEKLKLESQLQKNTTGGAICKVDIFKLEQQKYTLKDLVHYIYENIEHIKII